MKSRRRLGCLAILSHIARLHPLADKFFRCTSATASANSPRTRGPSCEPIRWLFPDRVHARKFRTIPGFPSESKVVTRTFQPAANCALCDLAALGY
jgi:hypothetical protein